MKAVLISIKPKWVEKIANKEKTIEVRKTRPKIKTPFKCYIYCTIGNGIKGDYLIPSNLQCGKVIGEFLCDKVYSIKNQGNSFVVVNEEQGVTNEIARQSCLEYDDMVGYLGNKDGVCQNRKQNQVILCKNLDCDCKKIVRPPQSWCYVE